jgi:uncharacterized protein YecE (DUF72 family)
MLPLFPEDDAPGRPAFDRAALAARLAELGRQQIYLGTSSWKYDGWLGQIYTRDRYSTRGRFSQKRFEQECLAEYAEVFPIVCGDFSFYQFPSADYWARLFAGAPPQLQFALKVPEDITVRHFPGHPRYGARANAWNPGFLDFELFDAAFLSLLRPFRHRLAVLILEFGAFPSRVFDGVGAFLRELIPFLERLPHGEFRFAVEIRNPEFLGPEYFEAMHEGHTAHVFNAWTRMPGLDAQITLPGAFTTDFIVARALLRQGRSYEEAVQAFSPYDAIQDENPPARQALRQLIRSARETKRPAFLFVNNRLEGNAPKTIEAIVND